MTDYELEDLLQTALLDPLMYQVFSSIISEPMTPAYREYIKAELWGAQPTPRELYAPTQTETAKWMRKWIMTDAI